MISLSFTWFEDGGGGWSGRAAPKEMAEQFYLLAKTTMVDRDVSAIYTIAMHDNGEREFRRVLKEFRQEMSKLTNKLTAVILSSRDLSQRDANELTRMLEAQSRGLLLKDLVRMKTSDNRIYFQLQKTNVQE